MSGSGEAGGAGLRAGAADGNGGPGWVRLRDGEGGHDLLGRAGVRDVDAGSLRKSLEREVRGGVRFDRGYLAAYAHDSSNYRQEPIGVVLPRDAADVEAAIRISREHGAPILPRGCGTSLSGETCNAAVVLDTSRYMREILDVDPERRTATVQPGVIRDQLAARTESEHRLTFGPDTSTHACATFGGMIGNNSCGIHSVMAGRTSDNIHELDLLLYDGTGMRVGQTGEEELRGIAAEPGRRGEVYARMRELRDRYASEIRSRFPSSIPRRVSGYNLDELLPENGFNLARALVGSEGTLATVLEATVRLVHSPPARSLLVLGYPDVAAVGDAVMEILEYGPVGLEAIDRELVTDMERRRMHGSDLGLLPDGGAWLLCEFGGDAVAESHARAKACMGHLRRTKPAPETRLFEDPDETGRIWKVREDGLATTFISQEGDHWPGWEDAAVPPERLGDYLREFQRLKGEYGYRGSLYGHFGDGCVHVRLDFDLRTPEGIAKWRRFLEESAELVVSHGGSLSGEHGDGQQRAELLPKMFGPELTRAFAETKAIWDPENGMNPHKVVDPYPIVSNMKLGAGYAPPHPRTHFAYREDGGDFAHAALRCVGAGKCRDTSSGTMCPSYMATLDERHTTRGRARILYEMLEGDVITDGWRSEEVHEALDLCLSCKGCKTDCPVDVDMATYKAEFLSRHYRRRLRPPEAYSMGLIMLHARLASLAPALANGLAEAPLLGGLLRRAAGISPKRAMPPFAEQTFKSWFAGRGTVNPQGEEVLLFPDTFNNFLHPEPMKATVEVLESAGFRVEVPGPALCCGRPLYDYGMLDTARLFWRRMLQVLQPQIRAGTPMVGVEPSCVASFRDELPNMLPDDEDAVRLSKQTLTLGELLAERAGDWRPPQLHREALVHEHCHQEADMGLEGERKVLDAMGLDYEVLDSGCCGMAGSFGFEAGHRDISVDIGEQRLLPAVREAPRETLLIADGFSCKTQIAELSDRRGLHLAQVIRMATEHGPEGPPASEPPERGYPDVEPARISRRALAGAAAVGLVGAASAAGLRARR